MPLGSATRQAPLLDRLPPVTLFEREDQSLLLTDGYHRVAAAQQAGRITVQADVRLGTKTQPIQFAIDVARAEWGVSADQAREAIRPRSGGQNNDAGEDS